MTQNQIATYRAALEEARASFEKATKRMLEIEIESYELKQDSDRLRRTITALAAMCSEDPLMDRLGITDSCMEVMQVKQSTVTTAEVVMALMRRGFDLESQKNAAASVHAVLSRLAKKGKIERVTVGEGALETVAWRGPNFDPSKPREDDDIPF